MGTSVLTSRAIIGEFYAKLEQGATGWANGLSFGVQSDQEMEEYKWLGMTPVMREWVGGRNAKGLRDNGYTIKNKPWEATLEISADDLRRDKTGQIMVRVREMAKNANKHWNRLISTLINNGGSTVCYDGQYFFDTDHSEGDSGSQSNALSIDISALPTAVHGSTTAPSVGEMQLVIMQAAQSILGFKDDQGEPMNEDASSFLVMTPTPLWSAAVAAVKNPLVDNGNVNTIKTLDGLKFDVVSNPRLTATDKVYVFRTDADVKPFIRQEEVPVEVSAIAEGTEYAFDHRKHKYGLYASGNAGYGFWQHAVQATMT